MDNTGDGSQLNLDLAVGVPTDFEGGVLVRPRLHGQYVAPNGLGGYAGIGMSTVMSSGNIGEDRGYGGVELGGLFQRALGANFDLGMRVGCILPTGRNDLLLHFFSTLLVRPSDLATISPDTTWLRLGVSPTVHRGAFFVRADLGLDVPVYNGQGMDPIGHVNVGAGIGHNRFIATAEMQTLLATGLEGEKISSFSIAGLSARYQGRSLSPFVLVSTPVEKDDFGEIFTVTGGLTLPF